MADNRTMAQLLQAPTEGYEDAIVIPEINANFELKHGLINLVQNKQFFVHDKEDPHAHIRYFNKITSTMRFSNVPSTSIKLMLFPFSLEGSARIWLEKEPPRSILTWDDLVSKFINQFFPPSKTTNLQLHQLDTFYNALNANDQDSLNSAAGGNFLDKMPRECLRIIETAAANFNQGNSNSRPSMVSNQIRPPGFPPIQNRQVYQPPTNQPPVYQAPTPQPQGVSKTDFENYVKANDDVLRNMQNQGQGLQNQMTNLTEMLSKFITSNTASSSNSGTLPSQIVTNPREHVNAITTRSGKTCEGPSTPFHTPIVSIPLKEPEQNPETSMDKVQKPSLESTTQVPPPKPKAKKTVQEPNSLEPDSYQTKLPYPERMK
ncbi:reverse transcriptase domain-containing protein, partial [Tanacetum coccineum]